MRSGLAGLPVKEEAASPWRDSPSRVSKAPDAEGENKKTCLKHGLSLQAVGMFCCVWWAGVLNLAVQVQAEHRCPLPWAAGPSVPYDIVAGHSHIYATC